MKNFIWIILFLLVIAAVLVGVSIVNSAVDHATYKVVEKTTVLYASDFPVFVPEGAYIIGIANEVSDIDGRDEIDKIAVIPEGIVKKKVLVKAETKIVVYFYESEKAEAQKLLNN